MPLARSFFIIAILAILAAAIAAGSGSFTAPTASEGAKTKSSALIQMGDNLKIGMDRLTMENSVGWGQWNISVSNTDTANNNDLFSPSGGRHFTAFDLACRRILAPIYGTNPDRPVSLASAPNAPKSNSPCLNVAGDVCQ